MTQVGPQIGRLPNDADVSDTVSHLVGAVPGGESGVAEHAGVELPGKQTIQRMCGIPSESVGT